MEQTFRTSTPVAPPPVPRVHPASLGYFPGEGEESLGGRGRPCLLGLTPIRRHSREGGNPEGEKNLGPRFRGGDTEEFLPMGTGGRAVIVFPLPPFPGGLG